MNKEIPVYSGTLRSHSLNVPAIIHNASGIIVFGKRIKSLVFSTDVSIIKNINTDAVLAVYPFTPQASISEAIIAVSDVPVFAGVGGGLTSGQRSVRMAAEVEMQGGFGIVVNAPMAPVTIAKIKKIVELPVVTTIVSKYQNYDDQIRAGADILNVSAAEKTAELVKILRDKYPSIPIIATGGPTDESIAETIAAGANAITYTPPANGELFRQKMKSYRSSLGQKRQTETCL